MDWLHCWEGALVLISDNHLNATLVLILAQWFVGLSHNAGVYHARPFTWHVHKRQNKDCPGSKRGSLIWRLSMECSERYHPKLPQLGLLDKNMH